MDESRENVLKNVFYHPKTGFGSVETTFRQAKKLHPSINRSHVREFLSKQKIRQHRKPRGNEVNSYVPDNPRQEFQVDLLDMGASAKPYRYGFTAIDIFTKKGCCIPIRAKTAEICAKALKEVFHEIGYPNSIMCDDGGEFKREFAETCKDNFVDIILSITGGRFVERFIRTLKYALSQRTKSMGGPWTKYVHDVVDNYNDTVHSSTGEKPDHIADNEYDFKLIRHAHDEMQSRAKFPMRHPQIDVGDYVKIRIKQKAFYKETDDSWSQELYKVLDIKESPYGKQYYLQNYRRPLLRFEIKKVEDSQHLENGELKSLVPPEPPRKRRLRPLRPDQLPPELRDEPPSPKLNLRRSKRVLQD